MTRYWIGVASRQHVLRGVAGGFCQVCHGKAQPLARMAVGDWIVYYSGKEELGRPEICQRFTAIGRVVGEDPYPFAMSPGFVPFRRDVAFRPAREADIRPLLDRLSFVKDRSRWGFPFRRGHFAISQADFQVIAAAMVDSSSLAELPCACEGMTSRSAPSSPASPRAGAARRYPRP